MTTFDELVGDGERAPTTGWNFAWLDGRADEARPSWRYFDRVSERAAQVAGVAELQAGTGSMIGRLPALPELAVATEGYAPNVEIASAELRRRRIHLVVTSERVRALPLRGETFELVISRHPVEVWWEEIARVLRPGGTYFAQHVGPHSLQDLAELFVDPWPARSHRDPEVEATDARRAGLVVDDVRSERTRVAFHDIGAVVYFLRLVPWIVPGFTVSRHRDQLRRLHERLERDGPFVTTSSRTLIEASKPT